MGKETAGEEQVNPRGRSKDQPRGSILKLVNVLRNLNFFPPDTTCSGLALFSTPRPQVMTMIQPITHTKLLLEKLPFSVHGCAIEQSVIDSLVKACHVKPGQPQSASSVESRALTC